MCNSIWSSSQGTWQGLGTDNSMPAEMDPSTQVTGNRKTADSLPTDSSGPFKVNLNALYRRGNEKWVFLLHRALGLPEVSVPLLTGPELLLPSNYSPLCLVKTWRGLHTKEKCSNVIAPLNPTNVSNFHPQDSMKNNYYHLTSWLSGTFIFLSHFIHNLQK